MKSSLIFGLVSWEHSDPASLAVTSRGLCVTHNGKARRAMGYGHGVIRRQRESNPEKGMRVYHGPCEGCGRGLHTVGDPPRKLCCNCCDVRELQREAQAKQAAEEGTAVLSLGALAIVTEGLREGKRAKARAGKGGCGR